MDRLGSHEECGIAEPIGRETIQELETQGSCTPMPQQRTVLRHATTRETPSGTLLKWCQELLWQDNITGSSIKPMPTRSHYSIGPEHAKHDTWDEPPYPDSIWQFYTSSRQTTWDTPIAGIGQGNGARPSIWAAVSSQMFDIVRQDGFYALLTGAISQLQRKVSGFFFVDDTDLCVTHMSNNGKQVVQQMQEAVTQWDGLLWATGEALALEKCFWYLVDFKYANTKWKYKTCSQAPGNITMLDSTCKQVTIQRLEPSEARQTLGVRLALDRNMEAELAYLVDMAKAWQWKMKNSWFGQWESNFSLQNVTMQKLIYPLPATTFTQKQCKAIISPILAQGLPLAGYICTFPHALAHGPKKFCGVNIPNLYTEQTLAHIHTLLKFLNQPQDLTGFLLQATGETMCLEIGLTSQLFDLPLLLQDLVTDTWMKQTWIVTCKANVHFD